MIGALLWMAEAFAALYPSPALRLARTVMLAADVARCESSTDYEDGAVVLQTAVNRSSASGRPLADELAARWQFAHGCPGWPRTWSWRHVVLGLRAATGTLRVPAWARRARHYTGRYDKPGLCERWGAARLGTIQHTFCGGR